MKSDVAPTLRQMKTRLQERKVAEADASPRISHISHTLLAQSLERRLIDSRWVSKRQKLLFDQDPDELLGRFKWFFTERLQHLIPSPLLPTAR